MRLTFRRSRRSALGIAALAIALVAGALMPGHAFAGFTVCEGDPLIHLSNGVDVQIDTTIGDVASDVQSVVYTVYVPAGVTIGSVTYTGDFAAQESVQLAYGDRGRSYSTDTFVTTGAPSVSVTTQTTITRHEPGREPVSASVSGTNGQHLQVSLGRGH